jgi:hypothetical protein
MVDVNTDLSDADLEIYNTQQFHDTAVQGRVAPVLNSSEQNMSNFINVLPAIGAAAVDTFGTSFGVLDEGEVQDYLKKNAPSLHDFYDRNKEGVTLVADIASAFLPATAAMKAIQGGSFAAKLLTSTRIPHVEKLFTSSSKFNKAYRNLRKTDLSLAKQGATGEIFASGRRAAARNFKLTKTMDGLKQGLAAELAVYGSMNESEVLYPSDFELVDHLAFASLGVALPPGFNYVFARRAAAQSAKRTSPKAFAALNRDNLPVDQLLSRPNERDVPITVASVARKGTKEFADEIAGTDAAYSANLNRFSLGLEGNVQGYIGKLGTDKQHGYIRGVSNETAEKTANNAVKEDPYALLGVVGMDPVPTSTARVNEILTIKQNTAEAFEAKAKALREAAAKPKTTDALRIQHIREADKLMEEAGNIKRQQMFVMTPHGEHIPLDEYRPLFRDDLSPGKARIKTERPGFDKTATYVLNGVKHADGARSRRLAVNSDFLPIIGKRVDDSSGKFSEQWSLLDSYQKDAMFDLFDTAIDRHKIGTQVVALKDDHWMRLEALVELRRRRPQAANDITLDSKYTGGWDELELDIVKQKYKEFVKLHNELDNGIRTNRLTAETIRHQLNLPAYTRGDTSPMEELFTDMRIAGYADLDDSFKSMDDLRAMVSQRVNFGDPEIAELNRGIVLRGNQFNTVKEGGNTLPNVMVARNPVETNLYTQDGLVDAVFAQTEKAVLFQQAAKQGSTFVAPLVNAITNHPAYAVAKRVDELSDSAVLGKNIINTSRQSTRLMPTMQAAHDLQTVMEKEVRSYVERLYTGINKNASQRLGKEMSHAAVFQELRQTGRTADLVSWSQYTTSRRMAWDLDATPRVNPDGTYSFTMTESAHNKRRFKELYGEEMPKGTVMPDLTSRGVYKELAITPAAFEAADSMRQIGRQARVEQNVLFSQIGGAQLKHKEWWLPPTNFRNKHVAFIVHPISDGGTSKRAIIARTNSELQRKIASQEVQAFIKESGGVVRTPDDFERYFALHDEVFHEMLDVSDPAVQLGKRGTGNAAQVSLEEGRLALDEAVDAIRNQANSLSKRVMHTMFEPQIAFAQMMHKTQGKTARTTQSIYENYANSLLGNRALNAQYGLGRTYNSLERQYDDILLALYDRTESRGVSGTIRQKIQQGLGISQKQLDRVQKELGVHAPVDLTVEALARSHNVRPPATMQKNMAALNELTSALVLRMFEIGHPLLNFSGVLATMPAVVQGLERRHGELRPEWIARISAWGTPLSNTQDLAAVSPVKMMASAAHYGFTPAGKHDWDLMVKYGFMRQEVSEITRTIQAPAGGFMQTSAGKMVETASFLSDKSEEFSRGWAHMAGVKLARENLGLADDRAVHTFAHRFANELIGDYRASNRPQVFQGAVGLPLGLFQTYVWNYYQRLFGYVERADVKSFGWQAFSQSSVFGAASLPGFSQYQNFFGANVDQTNNPVDALNRKLGPDAAELILNGTLSNIPKLFSDDGIALYTRGDTNFQRLPAFLSPTEAPVVQMAMRTFGFLRDTIDQALPGGQFSWQQQAEILGQYSMNRPLSRLLELASGYAVDRRGQVVSDDVRTGVSVAARVMGMRPMQEQKQIEVMWRQRQTEYSQREMRSRTRKALRAMVRGDEVDANAIREALVDYIEQGGNPAYFPTFLRDQFVSGINPKAGMALEKAIKAGKLNEIIRLNSALAN